MILIIICFINRFYAQNCTENENSGCDLGNGWVLLKEIGNINIIDS